MDLSKKLAYYKKEQKTSSVTLSPSLLALQEHFDGEILFDESPVLKITHKKQFPQFNNTDVSISLLSKYEFKEPVPRRECVFFDLETTGLIGGAGTFAFLIGFSYWQEDSLVTEQFFLPDYGREYSLFNILQEWLTSFEYIVSYNGKSYDMPLLSSRFVLNRMQPEFKKIKHIDLIHMCRRIWKNSLSSCDLKSVEKMLLNIERFGDIPGAFIPQAYFDFLNTGVIHDILRMIEHNRMDIVSSALIFNQLHFIDHNPAILNLDKEAITQLAKLAFRTESFPYFKKLENENNRAGDMPNEYKYWKSLALKKQTDWEEANKLWKELTSSADYCMFALEESAKYFEHVTKQVDQAFEIVESAFKRLDLQRELGYQVFEKGWEQRFEIRRERLKQKLNQV